MTAGDPPTGVVLAVCAATDDVILDAIGASGIDKRPLAGRISVGELGLVPDHVVDTKHHGGIEQAVYAYSEREALRWAEELGRELPPGWFGENLRIDGLPITDAVVGERWEIGDDGLVVETTIPRTPCRVFAAWAEEDQWIKRFLDRADTGSYLRVVTPGSVGAGDAVRLVHRPDHRVTVRDLLSGTAADAHALATLLACEDLGPKVRREASRKLAHA
ncbi:MOSC domain-containing protein [Gordonia hankookensis]|uniref:MOSC domain-containing protein n=1 Tax=Gordonia hankookensis TaxID=589403 RepID=A0ABR7W9D2_9ACTN|nr:MOSC domain-containing protein [Gordonia hankookensis]MBD1319414.1 MOSC domain-containing protein [Gordonia hankookensis]